MRLVADIESDGLLDTMTVIHSLCLLDVDTGKQWSCTDHPFVHPDGIEVLSIRAGLQLLIEADQIIFHNGIQFDIPGIQKVEPWFDVPREKVLDTLILSRLIWPDIKERDFTLRKQLTAKLRRDYRKERLQWERQIENDQEGSLTFPEESKWINEKLKLQFPGQLIGSHGLEAWGYRMGEWKGDYAKEMKAKGLDPWANWNEDMQLYCDTDVIVTKALLERAEDKGYSAQAIKIEHDFATILGQMERNGFPFHKEKADKLQHRLMRRHAELQEQLAEAFPPITEEWEFTPKANNSKLGYVKGVPVTKSKEIIFNPSSRQHIARWLKRKYGWKPEAYTENGQAMVDEKVLKALPFPEAKLLAEYFLIDKRLGMLEGKGGKGLIPFGRSGRIHGRVNTNGAVTRRCTHSSPNMAQLPATNVPFGKDFRELMYAPEGWSLLGWDASGLELRCFAHYMSYYDDGAYTEIVLDGDIHWTHVIALGLVPPGTERYAGYDEDGEPIEIEEHERLRGKIAKRFIYAYLYGAGHETIGEIVLPNGTAEEKRKEGERLTRSFLKRTPALKRLKQKIAKRVKETNSVTAIDGGTMFVRSQHSALNTLLQSAGAIAVKVATILFHDKLIEQGLVNGQHFEIVAHVHDEVQALVKKGYEDIVGRTAEEAMREAGEVLGFRCPLAAEYKHGPSWAQTH
jgi:DNA polymerase I-like protein with 3'-5' exonuclease and polymerase domains